MKNKLLFVCVFFLGAGVFAQAYVINGREWVDLGLPSGTLWATCNIGAESPEEYGEYFNWDDNPVQEYWDEHWRTPTKSEIDELVEYCTYSVEYVNGVKGARYTGRNGQSVFFPFAGYYKLIFGPYNTGKGGQYWTVTPYDGETGTHWILATDRSEQADDNAYYWPLYYFSFPVRPVSKLIPGDVNGDGVVDVSDFTMLANYILGKSPEGFIKAAADVTGSPTGDPDGDIDVSDLTGIANIILHGQSTTASLRAADIKQPSRQFNNHDNLRHPIFCW